MEAEEKPSVVLMVETDITVHRLQLMPWRHGRPKMDSNC